MIFTFETSEYSTKIESERVKNILEELEYNYNTAREFKEQRNSHGERVYLEKNNGIRNCLSFLGIRVIGPRRIESEGTTNEN